MNTEERYNTSQLNKQTRQTYHRQSGFYQQSEISTLTDKAYSTTNRDPFDSTDKWCLHCNCSHPRTPKFWNRNKANRDGLSSQCKITRILYNATNRDQIRENCAIYHATHRKQRAIYNAVHRNRTAKYMKNYRTTNPKSIAKHKAKYAITHADQIATRSANRRALKLALPNTLTNLQWHRALTYWNHHCAYCNKPLSLGQKMARDHYIPLTQGGGTTADNIIPACHSHKNALIQGCNNKKYNSNPSIWIVAAFGKRKAKQIIAQIESYFNWVKEQDAINANR